MDQIKNKKYFSFGVLLFSLLILPLATFIALKPVKTGIKAQLPATPPTTINLVTTWTKHPDNPVLVDTDVQCFFPESILSDINDPLRQPLKIAHPVNGIEYYWLYYDTCWRGGGRLAYSSDLIHWKPYEKNPVINPITGEVTLFIGHMFKDKDKYYIFYDITAGCPSGTCYDIKYSYANSPFGPWTRGQVVLQHGAVGQWDEGRVTESFITKYNGSYYLYYMGDLPQPFGRGEQVAVAVTAETNFPNGPWTKKGLMLPINQDTVSWDRGLTADPSVIQVNDRFYLLYTGSTGNSLWRIGIAWAENPLGPWNRPKWPLLSPGPVDSWDDYSLLRGSIHYLSGKFYLPYAGSDGQNFRGGLATLSAVVDSPAITTIPTIVITPTPSTSLPTVTPESEVIQTKEFFVASGNDDAYQQSSTVYLTNPEIKIGWYDPAVGFRVSGVGLADIKGKNILSAKLKFTSKSNTASNISQRIYLQDSDTCSAFTTVANNIANRPVLTPGILWNIGTTSWVLNKRYASPDLSRDVAIITSRSNWDGKSLCVLLKSEGGDKYAERQVFSKESGALPASLEITYSSGSPSTTLSPTPTPISTINLTPVPTISLTPTPAIAYVPKTITLNLISNSDDAYQTADSAKKMYVTNPEIKLGWYMSRAGFRFASNSLLADLKGKAIINATLKVFSRNTSNSPIRMQIYGQKSNACSTFTATSNDLGLRPLTSAKALWNLANVNWLLNYSYTTPDLKNVIQEIVNQPGYAGSSICIIAQNEGSPNYTERQIYAKESGSRMATLQITYNSAGE